MQTQIMIFGKDEKETKEIFNAIHMQKRWEVVVLMDAEMALEKLHRENFDLIIFANNVATIDENKLRKVASILQSEMLFMKQNDEVALEKEIAVRLNRRNLQKQARFAIKDDAFKNVVYNISMN